MGETEGTREASHDRPTALLIDDDADVLETRGRLFSALGMEPIPVLSLEKARSALKGVDVDVIVVDVNLSGLPGDQSGLTWARELGGHGGIPIVVYSGFYDIGELPDLHGSGIDAWIVKGTGLAELEASLATVVQLAQAHHHERSLGTESVSDNGTDQ